MDSWPVNRTDLDAVIASSDPLTATYIRNLPETQKGFHTIEYLLFGEARDRVATELDARELEYLTGLTHELTTASPRARGQLDHRRAVVPRRLRDRRRRRQHRVPVARPRRRRRSWSG
jgi:hypothetical protein